jgi:deoxycytidylate deaminase
MADERREVFFGLIAPIGINLDAVELTLSKSLERVNYKANNIRLTTIFAELGTKYEVKYTDEYDRYAKLIKAGDSLCKDAGRNDILALYGIEYLKLYQSRETNDEIPEQVAHIFRQIKRPEEIITLKEVFGRNAMFISCYSSKENRKDYLVKKLLKTNRGINKTELESMALKIMSIDENEKDMPSGQRVMECYQHADFVLDCTDLSTLTRSADRLIDIYFGHPFISPSKDEYCSYFANAASYRSLDLSRQVGAAIFTDECEVVALGCNEVPKAGGGTYWHDSECDHRDYAIGQDSNQQVKQDMARDALVRLQDTWLIDKYKNLSPERLSYQALEAKGAPLRGSMISDVIEYGRMVHAEMNAITDAARTRKSTQDTTLYCTTMPCHLCTKLVIASGIKRVVYVQPYSKSLVDELFSDSVAIDQGLQPNKVTFETLKGVTPNGFRIAFRKTSKRKNDDGTAISWNPLQAVPTFLSSFPYYRPLEITASAEFKKAFNKVMSGTQQSLIPNDE